MDSDEALYARVKRGDMNAFDELYTRHSTRLGARAVEVARGAPVAHRGWRP